MGNTHYAKGITAEDLRTFLNFWPRFSAEEKEISQMLMEDKDKLLGADAVPFCWHELYELPIKEHLTVVLSTTALPLLAALGQHDKLTDWFTQLKESPSQVSSIPDITDQIDSFFDSQPLLEKDRAEAIRPLLAGMLGISFSAFNSLRCFLYHGCFLNELIERVRTGDDKALFSAVRMDPTVIGCEPVIQRISVAKLINDEKFLKKLKSAVNGTQGKREQKNFQKIRLILEVLHEAGATRLSDEQLYQLFVEELDLYPWDGAEGGNPEALRKFADTYMKKIAIT